VSRSERLSTQDQSHRSLSGPLTRGAGLAAVPRLSAPSLWAPAPTTAEPPPVVAAAFTRAQVEEFVTRVVGHDEEVAGAYVAQLLAGGATVEAIYLDLLTPAARELGELWSDDVCDFVDVTVALGRLQRILREISHLLVGSGARADAGRVLLSCIPGEQHTLGLFMVSEFFVRDGWEVSLGSPISDCDLGALLRTEWFDVIGFSVACNSRLSYLSREIPRLRRQSQNRGLTVLVGGRVFSDQPEMVGRVHADASALDARSAPGLARELMQGAGQGPRLATDQ
jgi:methanogenic corrinoid protein MtbC1